MAQHDYDIGNDTAANVRADINNVLAAIVSNNSGASEPSTTYANQWWYDSSNDILKIRNEADTAWIDVLSIDQVEGTATPSFGDSFLGVMAEPQVFTTSGTYTPTAAARYALVEVQGAGGAGGGVNGGNNDGAGSPGGGAGAYACFFVDLTQLTGNPTLVVGSGGTCAVAGNGADGGDTSYNDTSVGGSHNIAAQGGIGAINSGQISGGERVHNPDPTRATVVETTGSALTKKDGMCGGHGIVLKGDGNGSDVMGGRGGDSFYGSGGPESSNNTAGEDATGYGAGGGGANQGGNSTTNQAGGSGSNGLIIITEFF